MVKVPKAGVENTYQMVKSAKSTKFKIYRIAFLILLSDCGVTFR